VIGNVILYEINIAGKILSTFKYPRRNKTKTINGKLKITEKKVKAF